METFHFFLNNCNIFDDEILFSLELTPYIFIIFLKIFQCLLSLIFVIISKKFIENIFIKSFGKIFAYGFL